MRRPGRLILAAVSGLAAGGCAAATLHVIPNDLQRLDPNEPLVEQHRGDQAVYWIDREQAVCIAISQGDALAPAKGRRRNWALSLVLDGLPAGSGRSYRVSNRTLRGILHDGVQHERYSSVRGTVTIHYEAGDRLSGRFRLTAARQQFQVMTGWTPVGTVLLAGEFAARLDESRARPLVELTERNVSPRPKSTSRPTAPQPVSGPPTDAPTGVSFGAPAR